MLGGRIKQARIAAGLSLRGLAEASGNYISAQVIQKYEQGITNPGSDVLIKLAKALGVKVEYFFRPDAVQVSLTCPVYRKRASLSKKYLESVQAQVKDKVEKYLEIKSFFPEDRFDQISIGKLNHRNIHKSSDIEKLAEDLREAWSLGNDPIENMIDIVEDRGAMVIPLEASDEFDGLSCWANETIPVIVVKKGLAGDRQRSDLAHELGHLIMKVSSDLNEEKAAKHFSAAFLAPADAVYRELGKKRNNIDLSELVLLKKKYGMSMQQWIYRAKDLDIISESRATEWFKKFRIKKWYREEPVDVAPEEPQRFKLLVIQAVTEGIISPIRAAEFLDTPYDKFRKDLTAGLEENNT
ncbi:MAG: XRE family transcriptional regulator [Deltaproteobacteria bacterium]|nr:XRE family transcriptional regulator [Deltaproteobacteria bacterium]